MDVNIEQLRNVFSYANIIADRSGFTICYAKKDGWLTQCVENANLSLLKKVIVNSPSVSFQCRKGKSVNIFIAMDLPEIESKEVYFALESPSDVNIDELIDTTAIPLDILRISRAIKTMSDEAVQDLIYETMKRNLNRGKPPKYTHRGRYAAICNIAHKIANRVGFSYVDFPIEEHFDGCVELRVPEGTEHIFEFSGDLKDDFDELVEIATEINFESNVEAGYLNISFYA